MALVSRRQFIRGAGGFSLATLSLGAYAGGIEPGLRLVVTGYRVTPQGWPAGLQIKAAVIADIHACEPWMSPARIRLIAETANALQPDIIFLLGDFSGGHRYVTGPVYPEQWAEALSVLKAPLGAYAILGNHDWWHGPLPGMPADGAAGVRDGLRQAGIPLLENEVRRIEAKGGGFWVAGLGDQMAVRIERHHMRGVDDLDGTLARVTDAAPVILLAHEPFIFRNVPRRVALTLCGHTHGGQVSLPLLSELYAEERFGANYIYGHIVEDGRQMIISGGLGTSLVPIRFLRPPEIVEVTIGGPAVHI